MFVATISVIPNKNYEILGLVNGNAILTKAIGANFTEGIKAAFVSGNLKKYEEMMNQSRLEATERMMAEAVKLGADGIIGVKYSSSSIIQGASECHAYGTAIKFY